MKQYIKHNILNNNNNIHNNNIYLNKDKDNSIIIAITMKIDNNQIVR